MIKTAGVIVFLIVVIATTLFVWSRAKRQQINSFWDVVRNPDAMPDLDEYHREVDEVASALSGTPAQVAQLVDRFVFEAKSSADEWTELRILAELGEEAYPRALEILRDPALTERLSLLTDDEEDSLPSGPINRLCKIFNQDAAPPEEAASLLAPFLQSESDEIRKSVALIIGSIASDSSLPDLRRALSDEDEYVRSYALMGIQRAIAGDRLADSSQADFFAMVANLWPGDTSFSACEKIPLILLKLDRDRATEYLLNDELFSVGFPAVVRILEAFKKESVEVPRTRLLTIIDEASTEPLKYPMDRMLEAALPLLGGHRDDDDLAMLERFLDHSNENVSRGATQALYRFHRYDERIRDPWSIVDENGWAALTAAEKHLLAIKMLDAEVRNGGFAQYYFNSSGDHWQEAYQGLAAVGAEERHRLMSATRGQRGKERERESQDYLPAADQGD